MYLLILIMHVGAMGSGNSNAITTAELMSKEACMSALKEAKKLTNGTVKNVEGVCVEKKTGIVVK